MKSFITVIMLVGSMSAMAVSNTCASACANFGGVFKTNPCECVNDSHGNAGGESGYKPDLNIKASQGGVTPFGSTPIKSVLPTRSKIKN